MIEFKEWPKIQRLGNQQYYITEKLDGTNSCVVIDNDGNIAAQSRTRIITPNVNGSQTDNSGFAAWVEDNKEDLLTLGPGHHFGEWWGQGIQRGYGLDKKVFSLFSWWLPEIPDCCQRVPLFKGDLEQSLHELKKQGSKAAPGWAKPEGLILVDKSYKTSYKVIID